MASATTSTEYEFVKQLEKNPRIVSAHVQVQPMGRIEKYAIELRLPNDKSVGFYTHSLKEAKLRVDAKINDWYLEAINE